MPCRIHDLLHAYDEVRSSSGFGRKRGDLDTIAPFAVLAPASLQKKTDSGEDTPQMAAQVAAAAITEHSPLPIQRSPRRPRTRPSRARTSSWRCAQGPLTR
jgi:hypothetical protein